MTKSEVHAIRNFLQTAIGWLELGQLEKAKKAMIDISVYLSEVKVDDTKDMH